MGSSHCSFLFFYWFIIVITKFFSWGMFLEVGSSFTLSFIQYSRVSFSWFFIWVTLFVICHVDIIIFKGYPGWLFLQTHGPSAGCSSLVWEDSLDLCSVGFNRCCCCCIYSYVCGTSLRCGAVSLSHHVSHVFLFVSGRPSFICWSLSNL